MVKEKLSTNLLIEKSSFKWNEFQTLCLLEVINEPNKEAVNNKYILSDEDCKYAPEKAHEKLPDLKREQDETGQDQGNKLKRR